MAWGDDSSILKKLEELGNVDLKSWFAKGEDGEISVGIELNESSDHKYDEIIFYPTFGNKHILTSKYT